MDPQSRLRQMPAVTVPEGFRKVPRRSRPRLLDDVLDDAAHRLDELVDGVALLDTPSARPPHLVRHLGPLPEVVDGLRQRLRVTLRNEDAGLALLDDIDLAPNPRAND